MARELPRMTFGRVAGWVSALALCIAFATPLPAHARARHVLWTVQGQHNTVYLLGSIHVLRATDGGLPEAAMDAYQDAEQLVMEIDMDDLLEHPLAMAAATQRLALLPSGQTLRGVLGPEYAAVEAHTRGLGLDAAILDRFQPWFVATLVLQAELAKRGFASNLGVEETLTRRAMADHKPIGGLETVEQQLGVLAGLPMAEQKRFLLMSIEELDDFDADLAAMLDAWRAGDTKRLADVLGEGFEKFPELYRPLTEDRNRAWVDEIAGLLDDDDDYLVVVGALHLVGRNSVVDLLEKRGYTVTQR